MKHLFLNYSLSLLAKEKGFNEPCLTFWFKPNNISTARLAIINQRDLNEIDGFKTKGDNVAAPLYQQIIDWFREKHNINLIPSILPPKWYSFSVIRESKKYKTQPLPYYQALDAAITEAFKLI